MVTTTLVCMSILEEILRPCLMAMRFESPPVI
jgi:hypothetical protein